MADLVLDVEAAEKQAIRSLRDLKGLKLKIASISDIHLNHPNTPTELIVRNLCLYAFPDNEETRSLDIIFICGDFTDRLMDAASGDAVLIRKWVASFIRFCKKHNIKIRVLEGTKLHDWGQSIMFIEENENHNIGCDVKYFKDISIEHIEDFGIDVLYIPDEIRPTTDITWRDVCQLLEERGLEQVDYAIMHGQFAYQLPEIANVPGRVHDKDKYESIVRHYVFVGHIHQHRPNGKIIPNGSFDRLAHGEEGDKGHVRLIDGKIKFIVNHGAMRYFKINAVDKDTDEIIDEVTTRLGTNRDKFKIQLQANKGDVAFELVKRLTTLHPFGIFDVQNIEKQRKRKERQLVRSSKASQLPILTRDNILEELAKEVASRNPGLLDACMEVAKGVVNAAR